MERPPDRQGKSFARGGVYGLALEEQRLPALRRIGRAVATSLDLLVDLERLCHGT